MDLTASHFENILPWMQVIARRTIRDFAKTHASARTWLQSWLKTAEKASWKSLAEVRKAYASADQFEHCLIFDKANDFRLIVRVTYSDSKRKGRLFVKHFLTHAQYDRDQWKECCR